MPKSKAKAIPKPTAPSLDAIKLLQEALLAFDAAEAANGIRCLSKRMQAVQANIRAYLHVELILVNPAAANPDLNPAKAELAPTVTPPLHPPGSQSERPKDWVEAGADLTNFREGANGVADFRDYLHSLGLIEVHERDERGAFVWRRSNMGTFGVHGELEIITGNNPITGEHYSKGREKELGYASYMGFQGTPAMVKKALKMLKKHAEYIKGIDPKQRQFI
jgi:hypothetical protein